MSPPNGGNQWDMPPAKVTNEQLYALLVGVSTRVTGLVAQNEELSERCIKLETDQRELLEAWRAAGTLLKFIKLIGAVAAAIGLIIATFKGVWSFK